MSDIWVLQNYHTSFGGDVEARKKEYADMVNKYYDLATSFYEYGELQGLHHTATCASTHDAGNLQVLRMISWYHV